MRYEVFVACRRCQLSSGQPPGYRLSSGQPQPLRLLLLDCHGRLHGLQLRSFGAAALLLLPPAAELASVGEPLLPALRLKQLYEELLVD